MADRAPVRIQRSRAKGWRMPLGARYVGRGSRWGNPFGTGEGRTASEAVAAYRRWLANKMWLDCTIRDDIIKTLRGHDLACWCPLDSCCHADTLLEIANAP
jgi:hypothetical protein